jgi:hypothetical protein
MITVTARQPLHIFSAFNIGQTNRATRTRTIILVTFSGNDFHGVDLLLRQRRFG